MIWWIGAGGIVGALCRYGAGLWIGRRAGTRFPWGTLLINITGSLALGLFAGFQQAMAASVYLFATTGFCGGFTTFSTFGYETIQLAESRRWGAAAVYVLASAGLGVPAAWVGLTLAGLL